MARDRRTIKKEMTDTFISNPNVIVKYGLTIGNSFEQEFSLISLENILFDIISFCVFVHEQIVSANAANSRPQNLPNFIAKVYNFHDGLPLKWIDGQFQYDLTGVANPDDLKIIDRCAVLESNDGELVVKVAHDNAGDLLPISNDQATRLLFYLGQMKVPGVRIRLINQDADNIKTTLNVYVDAQQIDLITGQQLNTTETVFPVKDAIKEYLSKLEFNGAFVTNFFEAAIQGKDGIKLCDVLLMQHKYAGFDFTDFTAFKIPESGYFKIQDADLTINYLSDVLVTN